MIILLVGRFGFLDQLVGRSDFAAGQFLDFPFGDDRLFGKIRIAKIR